MAKQANKKGRIFRIKKEKQKQKMWGIFFNVIIWEGGFPCFIISPILPTKKEKRGREEDEREKEGEEVEEGRRRDISVLITTEWVIFAFL